MRDWTLICGIRHCTGGCQVMSGSGIALESPLPSLTHRWVIWWTLKLAYLYVKEKTLSFKDLELCIPERDGNHRHDGEIWVCRSGKQLTWPGSGPKEYIKVAYWNPLFALICRVHHWNAAGIVKPGEITRYADITRRKKRSSSDEKWESKTGFNIREQRSWHRNR